MPYFPSSINLSYDERQALRHAGLPANPDHRRRRRAMQRTTALCHQDAQTTLCNDLAALAGKLRRLWKRSFAR